MKQLLLVLLLAMPCHFGLANSNTSFQDSLSQQFQKRPIWREFNKEKILSFKKDNDFIYNVEPRVKNNFFYNLINSIIKWLTGKDIGILFLNNSLVYTLLKWGMYLLMIATIVFAVIQLLKMRSSGLVQNKGSNVIDHDVIIENIHSIDFKKSIQEAIDSKKYRLLIRLYYLYALKLLSDNDKLNWQPWKTNYDYQQELNDENLKSHFYLLGYYFEFIWYGNFEVSDDILEEVKSSFLALEKVNA